VVLAGGTGGAMLAAGIQAESPSTELTVIANTADDDVFWGLLVCPDIDAVIYRLAGVFNETSGYGIKDDTFNVLDAIARVGAESWFRLGDKDLATHLLRAEQLRQGRTLTESSLDLCHRLGIKARVLPVTNDTVRTRFATDRGNFSFQEYFVRERLMPQLEGIAFDGIGAARPTAEVMTALAGADVVIIGPSNPLISVAPILAIVEGSVPRERTIAVSPIVGGAALKGPTVKMMSAMGQVPTPLGVARLYTGVAARFVIDQRDAAGAAEVEGLGYRTLVCDTVMKDGGRGLAAAILAAL
jgi:LPPG:FO 2-phospho-L-lactate transferase